MNELRGFDSVRLYKKAVIKTIEKNRAAHRAMFEAAMEGYKVKAIEILEGHIQRIKDGAPEKVIISLPIPQDHTDDYKLVLSMLASSIDEELEISSFDYQRYILDEWEWKEAFNQTVVAYVGK